MAAEMREYLYEFGYETPTQRKNNQQHGWDDEDCEVIYILASNEQRALEWGHRIAKRFVHVLYDDPDPSCLGEYAASIEKEDSFTREQLRLIPHVKDGEYPDIRAMVEQALRNG